MNIMWKVLFVKVAAFVLVKSSGSSQEAKPITFQSNLVTFNLKLSNCDNTKNPCASPQQLIYSDGSSNIEGLDEKSLRLNHNFEVRKTTPDSGTDFQISDESFSTEHKDPLNEKNDLPSDDRYDESSRGTESGNLFPKTTASITEPINDHKTNDSPSSPETNIQNKYSENKTERQEEKVSDESFDTKHEGPLDSKNHLSSDDRNDESFQDIDFLGQAKTRRVRRTDPETNIQNIYPENRKEAQAVLDLLQEGERRLNSEFHKDVVLVMGNTGAGKSTFTQFITGNDGNLISYETLEDSGDFIIRDISGKISNNSTITSWTIFPELIVDEKTNTKFYDCPGFSDTRGVAHDIAATYFTKGIVTNTNRIKLIFIINYSSVRIGVDRQDFMTFAKHVITAVKDIEKFNESIALVVTKVDNQYKGKNLVSDEKVILSIAAFLKIVKSEVQRKIQQISTLTDVKESYEKIVKFLDILLQQNDQYYPRIGIFRRPDDIGPISKLELLQEGKKSLKKIITTNTRYTKHTENDFDYTISAESKNRIHTLVETLIDNIASEVLQLTNEIKQQFSTQEEKINDIQDLYEEYYHGYETFFAMKTKIIRPRDYVRIITKNMNELSLNIQNKNLRSIEQYDRFLEFFSTFGARAIKPMEWIHGSNTLIEYLKDSMNWYRFLNQLFLVLSKYNLQRNKSDYIDFVSNFKRQMRASENHEERINFDSFKQMLQQNIGQTSEIDYENIKNVEVSMAKMTKLEMLLKLTIESQIQILCDETNHELKIQGPFVKLSDVSTILKYSCQNAKIIGIFALETVFIDDTFDLTGKEAQVSIIAPRWEIKGSQKITLDGAEGKSRGESWISFLDSFNGQAGLNGGPAGVLFGIGEEFVDNQLLHISAVGGRGGPGQDGHNGPKGIDGSIPRMIDLSLNWPYEKYSCKDGGHTDNVWNFIKCILPVIECIKESAVCTVYGRECTDGRKGGDGGVGGKGGKSGQVMVIGMNNASFSLNISDGEKGIDGFGGLGGEDGQRGKTRKFQAVKTSKGTWDFSLIDEFDWGHKRCSWGRSGATGNSYRDIQSLQEKQKFTRLPETINSYKAFIRENLSTNVRQRHLQMFLDKKLENTDSVMNLYDASGLLDDFQHLENQFPKLKKEISFAPLYKFLLNRIRKYAGKTDKYLLSKQKMKELSYLYTATLSKICSIHNNLVEDLVMDLNSFMDAASKGSNNLKDFKKIDVLQNHLVKYNESLSLRISELQHFLKTQVGTDLNDLFQSVNFQISGLINETTDRQNITKEEIVHLNKKRNFLENGLFLRKVLGVVEAAGAFLDFAMTTGEVTVATIERVIMIEKNALIEGKIFKDNENILALLLAINNAASPIKNKIESKKRIFVEELNNANKVLKNILFVNTSVDVSEIQNMVLLEIHQRLAEKGDDQNILDLELINKMFETRGNLKDLLKSKAKVLGAGKSENSEDVRKQQNFERKIVGAINAPDLGIKMQGELKDDFAKIENLGNALQQVGTKIEKLTQFEKNIFGIMISSYRTIEKNVQQLKDDFPRYSHVFFDIRQWKIQRALGDVRYMLQTMTREFQMSEKVIECINGLEESFSVMINVYDRIQNYYDNTELSAYIADITSNNSMSIEVNDLQLKQRIDDLQQRIQSNLVLQEYETAFNAFNQHLFPFASMYSSKFEPTFTYQPNETKGLISNITTQIEEMNKMTNISNGNTDYDKYLRTNVFFSSKSHDMPPFFTWAYNSNADIIPKLLEGKEVTIKADVTRGLKENSIKFSDVGVRFRLWNTTLQREMDKILLSFNVTMVHFGLAYYRCDSKFYAITSPQQVFSHSFAQQEENGELQDENVKKINYDAILSPYTMWTLKLKSNTGFNALSNLKSQAMNLELEGYGQYLRIGTNICTDDLERFYKVDKTVSEVSKEILF